MLAEAVKADENAAQIFKNGRASISLGYIGIHETINALYVRTYFLMMNNYAKKGIAIVRHLSEAVKRWQKKQVMPSAFTPRQAKTYATVSAV